jgi:hypothetical protein
MVHEGAVHPHPTLPLKGEGLSIWPAEALFDQLLSSLLYSASISLGTSR